jgi:hypothetical protein
MSEAIIELVEIGALAIFLLALYGIFAIATVR